MEDLQEQDLYKLDPQDDQEDWLEGFDDHIKEQVTNTCLSKTIWEDDEPIFIGGALYTNTYTCSVWSVVSRSFREGKNKFFVTRKVIEFLDYVHYTVGVRRLQTTVVAGFNEGHKWAKILGFEVEGLMKSFEPDGSDAVLYGRVR